VGDTVLVFVSAIWETTCIAVRAAKDAKTVVIDSPVLPAEIDVVRDTLTRSGFEVAQLISTHGDWDHLFGQFGFPDAPHLVADTTIARLAEEAEAQWNRRQNTLFDQFLYIDRQGPLDLDRLVPTPDSQRFELDTIELELLPTAGHTNDGLALVVPDPPLIMCGDYLSPLEIPKVRGSVDNYLSTLDLLEQRLTDVELVVPGHGWPLLPDQARILLEEDRRYLHALIEDGEAASLPPNRDTSEQHRVHRVMNVAGLAGIRNWSFVEPYEEGVP
jgi:glyoxylase-like metal-dependent hydrolase (beta-lactamase superfamily II)